MNFLFNLAFLLDKFISTVRIEIDERFKKFDQHASMLALGYRRLDDRLEKLESANPGDNIVNLVAEALDANDVRMNAIENRLRALEACQEVTPSEFDCRLCAHVGIEVNIEEKRMVVYRCGCSVECLYGIQFIPSKGPIQIYKAKSEGK